VAEKCCRICGETKELDDFPNRSGAKDGKRNDCKRCLVKRTSGRDRSEYSRNWRAANKDHIREYRRLRPAQRAEYFAQYRAENRASVLENEKRYRDRNKHKEAARRHSRRALSPLGPDEVAYIKIIQGDPCAYCGGTGGTVDHIRPVSAGGGNSWGNFAGACLGCNSSKNTRELLQFMLSRC